MSTSKQANGQPPGEAARQPAAKKPYQKPAFRHERVFETMAVACGKTGTQSQCSLSVKNS
ncbi:MAG: hypothetical protein HY236_17125 [Acidobacteria bacterium]|nr:hypothetical protein [Acidobacteriota bacterium]